jgi:hypothetical protein
MCAFRQIFLDEDELKICAGLYTESDSVLGLTAFSDAGSHRHSKMVCCARQIRGTLWSGQRYFQSYFLAGTDDVSMHGAGLCCVSWNVHQRRTRMGIIRDIFSHRPYHSPKCPSVYVFEVEILLVQKPSKALRAVPLSTCRLSGERVWLLAKDLETQVFSLQPVDGDSASMYIIELS